MKKGRRPIRALCAIASAGLVLAACGSDDGGGGGGEKSASASGEKKNVCFLFQDVETEFWAAGIKLISGSIKERGWSVRELNSQADANRQLEQVRSCISRKVDGIIVIPHDAESVVNMIALANREEIPIGVFNRPPAGSNPNANIQVVANNQEISKQTNEYLASEAKKLQEETGKKVKPLIMVGDLGDSNAVNRKKGFDEVIAANPDVFDKPVEVATKWDAETGRAGLQSAMQANPDVGMLFTSSDFLFPQIRSVLQPLGKWKKRGQDGHVIMGGLDGDSTACRLIKQGYVDATGVQDLNFEADAIVKAVATAIEKGEPKPKQAIDDPGFALTAANLKEREKDMWGCTIAPPSQ